jgi:hypothetical protein
VIKIEKVDFPYCVTIPVSEENSSHPRWYRGLREWLSANLAEEKYEIVDETAWIVAINVKEESDAMLIKIAWEDGTPMSSNGTPIPSSLVD